MSVVSVIIPARNAEAYLADAIRSVFGQRCGAALEVLVVDDGSTDGTAQVARDHGATVLRGSGLGVSAARNAGVQRAAGAYIAFLDADDVWKRDKLARQIDYLHRNPDVGCVGTGCELFGATEPRELFLDDAEVQALEPDAFLATCRMYPSSMLLRAEVARRVEFPVGLGDAEDLVYLAMIRTVARVGAVEDCLFLRRMHPGQVTRQPGHLARALRGRLAWVQGHWRDLGVDLARAERLIVDAIVNDVWIDYWLGDFGKFHAARQELLAGWPAGVAIPDGLTRRVLPGWLVRAKRVAEHVLRRTA